MPLPLPDASGEGDSNSHDYNGISSSAPGLFPDGTNGEDMFYLEQESGHLGDHQGPALVACGNFGVTEPEQMVALPNGNNGVGNETNGDHKMVVPFSNEHRLANAVLDVFEECLREAKVNGLINGGNVGGSAEESELAKRWRVQRMDELDVLSRRLRLLVQDAAAAGH